MKKTLFLACRFALTLALAQHLVQAHDHLAVGAASPSIGAPLVFTNDADFGGDSGFVFNLTAGTTNDAYFGYYYTDDLVFTALAATGDNGGPEPGHAGLGAYIQVQLLSVEGPAGAQFGFWETSEDGVDSTNLTWSVSVPLTHGTNLIAVSENDGSPGADPYGHLHGRIYSVTKAGLYKATWQFVDTSTNGPNGGPVNAPSAPFYLYYQAGLTLGPVATGTNGLVITFAAPSNIPDDNPSAPPTNYTLQASPVVGPKASWQSVGNVVAGDDHLHQVLVPLSGSAQFLRLQAD